MENKSNHKNFVHLVGLYTYCKMMHGAYNVKLTELNFMLFIPCIFLHSIYLKTNKMLRNSLMIAPCSET